jgi:hypothetical protein
MGMQMRTVVAVVQVFNDKGVDISEKVAELMRSQGATIKEVFNARTCTHVVWQRGDRDTLTAGLKAEGVWVVKPSWVMAIKARRNWILEVKHVVDPKNTSDDSATSDSALAAVSSSSASKGKKANTGGKTGGKSASSSSSSSSSSSPPVAAKPAPVNMKRLFASVTCSVACFDDKGRNVGKRVAALLTAHGAKVSLPPSLSSSQPFLLLLLLQPYVTRTLYSPLLL